MHPNQIKQIQKSVRDYSDLASQARAEGKEYFALPLLVNTIADDVEPHIKSGILAELRRQNYVVSEWSAAHDGADAGLHTAMVVFTDQAKANAIRAGYVFDLPTEEPEAPATPQGEE